MKRFRWIALCLISLVLTLWLDSCSPPLTQVVNLNFCGTSMARNAIEEIEDLFQQEHPNVVINSIFAGTAAIEKAVVRGEPFDGVLFADVPPLDRLEAQGLIVPASRKELLTTDIVLIAPADSTLQVSDFQALADDRIKTVAIGNQNLAIGRYTHTLLKRMGIEQAVAAKAVVAKVGVREVMRAVEEKKAEVGITFLSEVKASPEVKILATAPRDSYEPIRVSEAVVKASAHPQEIQTYLNFLSSDQALAIFEKFGLRPLGS